MTTLVDGLDRWIYAVDVGSGQTDLKVEEDTTGDGSLDTSDTVSISTGLLWGHRDASYDSTLSGLYLDLENALNGSGTLTNTYTVGSQTPSNSSVTQSGIQVAGDGSAQFRLDFSVANAIPPEWLGWPTTQGTTSKSSSDTLDSPRSAISYWQPRPTFADRSASHKDWTEEAELKTSSPDPVEQFQVQHGPSRKRRAYEYEWVPAAHVRDGKATDSQHADNAGLPTDDVNNAYYHFWDLARRRRECVVVHNDGDQDLKVDSHDYERGYLAPAAVRSNFEEALERIQPLGEWYRLTFEHVVVESTMAVK